MTFTPPEDQADRGAQIGLGALGHAGSNWYLGLEVFPNPGVHLVTMESDEVVANCPVTGQPDFYEVSIRYMPDEVCIESKSLKLYFRTLNDGGIFCEALAVKIRDDVALALKIDEDKVAVSLVQKARGGISIISEA